MLYPKSASSRITVTWFVKLNILCSFWISVKRAECELFPSFSLIPHSYTLISTHIFWSWCHPAIRSANPSSCSFLTITSSSKTPGLTPSFDSILLKVTASQQKLCCWVLILQMKLNHSLVSPLWPSKERLPLSTMKMDTSGKIQP